MGKLVFAKLDGLMKGKPGRHSDGDGLFFRTLGGVKAYWIYRYRVNGKEREITIGRFPELSLEKARKKHLDLRQSVVNDGADPIALKRAAKIAAVAKSSVPTFGETADSFARTKGEEWRSPRHRQQWSQSLVDHASSIMDTPVDQIDEDAVLSILEPIWSTVPETASRVRARIELVLNAAQAKRFIDRDRPNPARWSLLKFTLPNPKKVGAPRKHHAAMPYADVPAFVARLNHGVAESCMAFTILTAARSGEVLGATWDEIDLDAAVWTVPPSRMKMQKEHSVPLSDAAVAIIKHQLETRGESTNPHVFRSPRPRQPLSPMAMTMALRKLGAGDFTVHGMRSAFRDWAGNETETPREVCEMALAHKVGDATEQAYRRSNALDKRRRLMDAWADFVTGKTGDNVVPLRPLARADA